MSRLALNPELHLTREFRLISRALHHHTPKLSENDVRVAVFDAVVYVWKIAEKRGDVFDRYGDDLVIAVDRSEVDDICAGMADAFSAAEHWFRWEPVAERGDHLRLVGWLRNQDPGYGADIMDGKDTEHGDAETIRRLEARVCELEESASRRRRASDARADRRLKNPSADKARTNGGQSADKARTKRGQSADKARTNGGQSADKARTKCGQSADKARTNSIQHDSMTTGQQAGICSAMENRSENHAVVAAPKPPDNSSTVPLVEKVRTVLDSVDTVPLDDLADKARTTPDEFRTLARTIFTTLDAGGYAARAYNAGADEYIRSRYREFRKLRPEAIRSAIEHTAENPPEDPDADQPVQRWKAILADAKSRETVFADRDRESLRAEAERRREAESAALREEYRVQTRRLREWCEANPNADADAVETMVARECGDDPSRTERDVMRRRILGLLREVRSEARTQAKTSTAAFSQCR